MLNKNESRASIFQAFDALKGLREKLKEQEKIIVSKKALSEDDLAQLDRKIRQIKKGMIIQITYYDHGQYIQLEGIVSQISFEAKILQIVKTKIAFKNICDIQINDMTDIP